MGAVRGVLASLLSFMKVGVTHIGVATDHVIESFRKRSVARLQDVGGHSPDLLRSSRCSKTHSALRVVVADGGIQKPTMRWRRQRKVGSGRRARVERALCWCARQTSDLAQTVRGMWCRWIVERGQCATKRELWRSSACCRRRFPTTSHLVGDSADGYPGT